MAMPLYAIGVMPLLNHVKKKRPGTGELNIKHVAYVDDLVGGGELTQLRRWWDNILEYGPMLGYNPNAKKPWLIVKQNKVEEARVVFHDTNVQITTEGSRYLVDYIGENATKKLYVRKLLLQWIEQIETLSVIAKTEPQAAYAAYVSGLNHRFTYHMRTISGMEELHGALDDNVAQKFIAAITDGHICTRD